MFRLTVVLLFVLVSCSEKPGLEGVDLNAWKAELSGCGTKRSILAEEILNQKTKLYKLNQTEIVDLLGSPDEHELFSRNQKFFRYYTRPSKSCENSQTELPPSFLSIRFNALGLVMEVNYYQ